MTWKDITAAFAEAVSSRRWPNIRTFTDEGVYILNDRDRWKMNYATVILDLQSATVNIDTTLYNVVLWYIDRQREDRTDINSIISDAVATLGELVNFVRTHYDGVFIGDTASAVPFQDRFADECAGASLTFSISTLNTSIC